MTIKAAFNEAGSLQARWPAEHMKINMYNMFLHDQANKENERYQLWRLSGFLSLQWGLT